jgi:vacuolar-type H+-ATPase subunit H
MSKEYLKQILEQEEHADKVRHDGLIESRRIVSAATDEATALVEKAKLDADASYRETLAKATDEATADYDKTINQSNWECDMLLNIAEKNLDKAISVIVGKVVN